MIYTGLVRSQMKGQLQSTEAQTPDFNLQISQRRGMEAQPGPWDNSGWKGPEGSPSPS